MLHLIAYAQEEICTETLVQLSRDQVIESCESESQGVGLRIGKASQHQLNDGREVAFDRVDWEVGHHSFDEIKAVGLLRLGGDEFLEDA